MVTYMTCHLLGMSCTCTNPALYGYINNNLNKEISLALRGFKDKISTCKSRIYVRKIVSG